jgi:predicted nucleotidyltransferase
MRIDRSEMIAGQPITKVRSFLRRLGHREWSTEAIAEYFSIDRATGKNLIAELCRRNLLEKAKLWPGERKVFYQRGPAASQLALASFLKPISRKRATELVQKFLERVEAVNANDDLVYEVAEVRVFGSYLDPSQSEVGDVDLAVTLAPRHGKSHAEAVDLSRARAAASGRRFSNILQSLFYGQHEVLRQLKARSPYVSMHPPDDPERIGANSQVIFPRDARRESGENE